MNIKAKYTVILCNSNNIQIYLLQSKVGNEGYLNNNEMVLLNSVPDVLEMSSVVHVMLLVFLRLLAILKPLSYQEIHDKFRYKSIIGIWITSIFVNAAKILCCQLAITFENENYFYYGNLIIAQFSNTLPVVLILIMYIMLIWVLRGKTSY